ncbi:hypothetical protein LguiA_022205 [Lonicera macranthoides]
MDLIMYNSAAVICAVLVVLWVWRVLNWVWFRPKKLEKFLRAQGLNGSSYKILFGDFKKISSMINEAESKPISLSSDIVPRVTPWVHDAIKNYGKNCFLWMGTVPKVYIMDPELIREVLHNPDIFRRPNTPVFKKLANGLTAHEGEKWDKHRKIINPAFHVEKLKVEVGRSDCTVSGGGGGGTLTSEDLTMYEWTGPTSKATPTDSEMGVRERILTTAFVFNELTSTWEKKVSTEGSCELDVLPYLETLTSDVISRTAFGSSYEEGKNIFRLQKELVELVIQSSLSVSFPGSRFLPTKRNRRMEEICKEVNFSLQKIIDKKMATITKGEASDDLLGMLLESNMKETGHGCKSVGMSVKDVIEECKVFYFAGQETTSVLLVWSMILLSMNPNWQTKAREEVLQVFGKDKPNVDGLNRLKIVTMILYEVLRLYSPIAALNRSVYKDTTLGEMSLPAGVQVGLPLMLIHHDYDIWGDDAKEFKPERFSKGVSNATNKMSFFPFSSGPRVCIGQNFAMLEAKTALSMILQYFSFELSTSYTHAPFSLITLQPQYGAQLILHKL